MAASEDLKNLVNQLPDPDRRGMYCTDIDKAKIEQTIAAIHQGGKDNVLGLIDLLAEPGQSGGAKPHYALHCLGNHLLQIKDEAARREFCQAIASQIGGSRPKVIQAYLCQELQSFGHNEAVSALGSVLCDDDLSSPAAMALVAIWEGAALPLRAALPKAKGACKLNIVQALGQVGDRESIPALRSLVSNEDREVRLAAAWGLARMGDAGSVERLIQAAGVEPGWERIQATKHCLVLAEKLAAAGDKAGADKIYAHLRDTRTDPQEKYIRDAAQRGLAAMKS
jgi:hypothetical protein